MVMWYVCIEISRPNYKLQLKNLDRYVVQSWSDNCPLEKVIRAVAEFGMSNEILNDFGAVTFKGVPVEIEDTIDHFRGHFRIPLGRNPP